MREEVWPLQLVFLLTLIGAVLGLFNPTLFGDRNTALILLGAALLSGGLLHLPWVRVAFGGVLKRVETRVGDPAAAQAGAGSIAERLVRMEDRVGDPAAAQAGAGSVAERLARMEARVGDPAAAQPGAGSIAEWLVRMEARVGDPAAAQAGAASIAERLVAIETRVVDMAAAQLSTATATERLDRVENLIETQTTTIGKPPSGTLVAEVAALNAKLNEILARLPAHAGGDKG